MWWRKIRNSVHDNRGETTLLITDNIVLLKCNTKYGSNMEDYQVRCTVAAMLYVGGQVKSYEEAMKIADSMLNASKQYQG